MNGFAQRLGGVPSAIGRAGGIGLALLLSACILGLSLLLPARQEGEDLKQGLQQLERKLGAAAAPARPTADLRQQLDEFLSSLPPQDQINAQLAQLNDLAARNHLPLKNGEYRTTSGKAGRIGRLQITAKMQGSYADFRRFLQELPATLPALALSRVSISRQKPSDTALEINVEFALFYTRAGT